ncbi:hypothetical protein MSAN_00305600 [Mycena sanguinolenta]|uniref:Uncharacterized protein n=1 Tax=Mycena sanguinolenta TaxID=230812 RepID=A0A8H6Z8F5_9AGAR|nr:hypothetical protein MSAN_00305600 [Mycena sanguinolenta]
MPSVFRGPRQRRKAKIFNISGGTGGTGGEGGTNGGSGGAGEGPRVKFRMVSGKTITNINKNYSTAPAVPAGFRTIPLGDLDLQREIQLDRYSGVVSVRRLYSGKIHAEGTNVVVALYQGDGAEAQWRRDVKKYMVVRHPNIVQLYGTVSCDLIPYQHVVDLYRHSHLSSVYIVAYMNVESWVWTFHRPATLTLLQAVRHYISEHFSRQVPCTLSGYIYMECLSETFAQRGLGFLDRENSEATIIDALPLNHYYELTQWEFTTRRSISAAPSATVNISSVLHCPSDDTFDDVVEIAWLPNAELPSHRRWHSAGNGSRFVENEHSDNVNNGGSTSGHPTNEAPNYDLVSPIHQDVVEVPDCSTSEETVESDHVDLPTASAHQDAEEMPVSSTFEIVLNAQLTLLFIFALFWVLSDM